MKYFAIFITTLVLIVPIRISSDWFYVVIVMISNISETIATGRINEGFIHELYLLWLRILSDATFPIFLIFINYYIYKKFFKWDFNMKPLIILIGIFCSLIFLKSLYDSNIDIYKHDAGLLAIILSYSAIIVGFASWFAPLFYLWSKFDNKGNFKGIN